MYKSCPSVVQSRPAPLNIPLPSLTHTYRMMVHCISALDENCYGCITNQIILNMFRSAPLGMRFNLHTSRKFLSCAS